MSSDTAESSVMGALKTLAVAAGAGVMAGFGMNKGGVPRPALIRETMSLSFLSKLPGIPESVGTAQMLVLFLGASGTSVLALGLINHYVKGKKAEEMREEKTVKAGGNVGPVVAGLFTLGMGMSIAGICPGTVFANIGSMNARWPEYLGGGVLAAGVYLWAHPVIQGMMPSIPLPKKARYLPDFLGTSPLTTSLALGGGMLAAAYALTMSAGYVAPYITSTAADYAGPLLTARYWNPILAGALVGAVQIPLNLILGKTMGCASTFEYAASTISTVVPGAPVHVMARGRDLLKRYGWQVCFTLGMAGGSALAAATSSPSNWALPEDGTFISSTAAFWGAFIAVLGARTAGGCTSGHGVSGMAKLSTASLIGVAAIFAGGAASRMFL